MLNLLPVRDRERAAIERDLDDLDLIDRIEGLVYELLDALPRVRLRHPDIKWQPADLHAALCEQLLSLRAEKRHFQGPVVIPEDE